MRASRNFPARSVRDMMPPEQRLQAATYAEHETECPYCGYDGRIPLPDCDQGMALMERMR
ncbi:MAG: hypothetical protein U0821_18790 [Chloroflexota bacterium]